MPSSLKKRFAIDAEELANFDLAYLVVAIKLPTGAIELITNTHDIPAKIKYYWDTYDDDFKLKANPEVWVVDYMIVQRS